jgi:hypothetical protein
VNVGKDEGAFAWLTLNYLLGYLGKAEEETMAAIDLGGGSVQQAFALTPTEASQAPDGYITKLSGGGKEYHVYVHRSSTILDSSISAWMGCRCKMLRRRGCSYAGKQSGLAA